MTGAPAAASSHWALSDLQQSVHDFEALLRVRCGRSIPMGSSLEDIALRLAEMEYQFRGQAKHDTSVDHRVVWREAIGLADLIKKALHYEGHPDFSQFCAHLQLFEETNSRLVQNAPSVVYDDAANKIFELLTGFAALRDGANIALEDPTRSGGGKNPDILVDWFGRRWSIACKSPFTLNPKTYLDNVEAAVSQINNATADRGLVVLNVRGMLCHEAIWPAWREDSDNSWRYYPAPTEAIGEETVTVEVERIRLAVEDELRAGRNTRQLFADSKAAPVILNYASAVCGVTQAGHPVVTTYRRLFAWPVDGDLVADDERVVDSLSKGYQVP